MSEKLKIYRVNDDYLNYLRSFDQKIPLNKPNSFPRPFVGILLEMGGNKYVAPLSSQKHNNQADFPIKNKNNEQIATVRFSYMFPVTDSEIQAINYAEIQKTNHKYAMLLRREDSYINRHRERILHLFQDTYTKRVENKFQYPRFCCDFKLLEKALKEFQKK